MQEHVPTSDMEQDEPDPSSSKGDKPKTPSSTSKIVRFLAVILTQIPYSRIPTKVVNYKPKSKDRADSKKEDVCSMIHSASGLLIVTPL